MKLAHVAAAVFFGVFVCSSAVFASPCPDLSGTYLDHTTGGEGTIHWTLKQVGCEKVSFQTTTTWPNKSPDVFGTREYVADGVIRQADPTELPQSFLFTATTLDHRAKNVNTEGCDEFVQYSLNPDLSLKLRWRFECPSGFVSAWFGGSYVREN